MGYFLGQHNPSNYFALTLEAMDIPIKEHFIHMGTAKKDMMLKEKIWYLVQDCDERETNLLIYSIEGIKKGLKKYQQDSRK